MNEYKNQIRSFFARFFRTDELGDAEDIFAGAYVNSLFAMQLIAWLEKDFELVVEDDDLKLSNFSSVDAIAGFIEQKRSAAALS